MSVSPGNIPVSTALDGVRKAIELNPANARQLPLNRAFESLWSDPEFRRLTGANSPRG